MAMTHDYMDYLNEKVGICPAGSQEEFQAANTIADLMRQHDTEPNIEEFDAKTYGGAVTGFLYALMFVGIVLGGIGVPILIAIGFVLAVGPAVLFVLKFLGHDFISGLGPTTRSQNVVAFHEATGPMVIKGNRPIVIVAHYDSPHENVLYTSPLAQFVPTMWRLSKFCVPVVAVCMLIQVLVFLPESFRRFLWIIGILAALPLAVLGVTSVLERFSNCTDGANDNKSGVAALLGVLENVRPSGLESVHGAESIEAAVEAMHQAAEQAAAAAAAQSVAEQPEIPYAGLGDKLAQIAPEPGSEPASAPAAGGEPEAAFYEEEVEEEPEPQFVYKRGKVEGVRHGADVVKSLGMLSDACDVEYVEPEPVKVAVPAKPAKKRLVRKPVPAAAAAAEAPAWAAPEGAEDVLDAEQVAYQPEPYGEEDGQGEDFAAKALSFLRGVGDKLSVAGHQIGEKVADVKARAEQARQGDGADADDAAAPQDFVVDAQYEQVGDDEQAEAPLPSVIPFRPEAAGPVGDEPAADEPGYAVEAFDDEGPRDEPSGEIPVAGEDTDAALEATAERTAARPAATTAAMAPLAQQQAAEEDAAKTAEQAAVAEGAVAEAAPAEAPAGTDAAPAGSKVNFDGLEDSVFLNPDNSGLTAEGDADATMPSAPVPPAPKPAAPDDPEWGKTSFRPQAGNVARRATLFDLPDPSAAGNDPFGTDPRAPKVDASAGKPANGYVAPAVPTSSDSGTLFSAPVEAKVDTISAEDEEFAKLQRADARANEGEGALGRLKGLFGKKGSSDGSGAKHGGWKGGAAPRAGLRVVDGDDAPAAPTEDDLRDEILGLGDDALISHDIWFVALGASDCDHAGMRAFLAQHRKQVRGAFVINLDSVAAGELTLLTHEGLLVTRRADRRMLRIMGSVANDLHIPVEMSKRDWATTDATPAMLSSMRAMTVMGTDVSGKRALSRTLDDVAENVVPEQAVAVAEAVCELIRRS